jgi:hypothetical protein
MTSQTKLPGDENKDQRIAKTKTTNQNNNKPKQQTSQPTKETTKEDDTKKKISDPMRNQLMQLLA